MNWKSLIPNGITLGNLLCGAFSIYSVSQDQMVYASLFILLAAFLDFFDGFAARALKVSGPLGTQLDSLADVISFGLAPTFIAAHLAGAFSDSGTLNFLAFLPFLMAVFAAFRLAKFNIDTEQSTSFKGLPTPANALFWLSLPLILNYGDADSPVVSWIVSLSESSLWIGLLSLAMGFLMISRLPLLALKFKSFGWSENKWKYILLVSGAVLLVVFQLAAIPIILLLYLIFSSIHFYQS
jgi:CDP-diacylglycerol--serine O-phosphatidyltransferase